MYLTVIYTFLEILPDTEKMKIYNYHEIHKATHFSNISCCLLHIKVLLQLTWRKKKLIANYNLL